MFTIQFENGLWSENISLKKILKLNVNLSSCLNLFSIWDLLKCMIQYKMCANILIPSPQKLNSIDYDYFSVLLWSFNEIVFLFKEIIINCSNTFFLLTYLTFFFNRKMVIVELLHNTQTCLCNTHLQHVS